MNPGTGLKDPRDLTQVPKAFFESERFQTSPAWQDQEELAHYRSVVAAFMNYQFDSITDFNKMIMDFSRLTPSQLKLLKYPVFHRLQQFHLAMVANHSFLMRVVADDMGLFEFRQPYVLDSFQISPFNKKQVRNILKQLRREWSAEGAIERDPIFQPIMEEIKSLFPKPLGVSVLVPGCGLGRLPYELASAGFDAQGNEFSYFMLLVSDFILNKRENNKQFTIHAALGNFNNLLKLETAFEGIRVPDVKCLEIPEAVQFSIVSGEFVEVYKQQHACWDVVVTCFFIDTARNILEYIEVVHQLLKPGGYWINMGPLMYHYSDVQDEMSIELSLEEVMFAVRAIGFKVVKEKLLPGKYCSEKNRMLEFTYQCSFMVAQK
jgi:carnosine N-methyltransferase